MEPASSAYRMQIGDHHAQSSRTHRVGRARHECESLLASLRAQGIARMTINEMQGDIYYDVTIEGVRFQAYASTDPYVVREDSGHWCQLGVASIHIANRRGRATYKTWMVCKYSVREGRIDLTELSDAGRRAFAVAFGVPIGYDHQHNIGNMFAFYAFPAFDGLVA